MELGSAIPSCPMEEQQSKVVERTVGKKAEGVRDNCMIPFQVKKTHFKSLNEFLSSLSILSI